MKAKILTGLILVGLILGSFSPSTARAQSQEISLRISPLSINFQAADPDMEPLIRADNPVLVEIAVGPSRRWQLTLRAEGDLASSQGPAISIQTISWTSTASPPFINGSLISRNAQLAASGQGPVQTKGELNFFFQNSWDYRIGDYSQTVSFILSVL